MIGKPDSRSRPAIRLAKLEDARAIARLCEQLGYPTTPEEVSERLNPIRRDDEHALFVAESSGGKVIGWVHAYLCELVVAQRFAELGGLVVDEVHRRFGVGHCLMQEVERWAEERGCAEVRVRSNIIREEAHAFYESIGYSPVKTQRTFRKPLHRES